MHKYSGTPFANYNVENDTNATRITHEQAQYVSTVLNRKKKGQENKKEKRKHSSRIQYYM